MKLKLMPSLAANHASSSGTDDSVAIPFLPHRRVARATALWAIAIGVWPVLIWKIFAAGARERRAARLANPPRPE